MFEPIFPKIAHNKLAAPGIGLTVGQTEYLYSLYEKGVLSGEIKYLKDDINKSTYNYLIDKSGLSGPRVVAFLLSIIEWAKNNKVERWRNPLLRKEQDTIREESVKNVLTYPFKIVGAGAKEVVDPITKPLMVGAVIVGIGAFLYGGSKLGLFKKIAFKRKK